MRRREEDARFGERWKVVIGARDPVGLGRLERRAKGDRRRKSTFEEEDARFGERWKVVIGDPVGLGRLERRAKGDRRRKSGQGGRGGLMTWHRM